MKKKFLLIAALCISLSSFAQTDTTGKNNNNQSDTIHVGNMVIVRDGRNDNDSIIVHTHYHHRNYYKPSNITTNWIVLDFGYTNYNDKTNYPSSFNANSTRDWFKLRTGKSVDVNIWLFMQRLNVYKHVVNLKYGLGIELNNYRYETNIKYLTNPTEVIMDTISYSKNKLAADYVTVPLMINFNFTPSRKDGFGISVGISAGYLYSSRQKLISSEFGKRKYFNSFDLNPWKISWIAEAQLGPVKLYGSLATQSMFNSSGPDQVPYTFGIRLSNW
jgi:hypothetical protein